VASERIPACASYLVSNAAPHVAEVIRRLRQESRQNWQSLLDQAFESSRATLCPERIRAILQGCCDHWTQEAYVSAVRLHDEALATAVKDRAVWDRRRTARTRRRLRPPDPGTGRVAGRTSYLLAETGFERSLSERTG